MQLSLLSPPALTPAPTPAPTRQPRRKKSVKFQRPVNRPEYERWRIDYGRHNWDSVDVPCLVPASEARAMIKAWNHEDSRAHWCCGSLDGREVRLLYLRDRVSMQSGIPAIGVVVPSTTGWPIHLSRTLGRVLGGRGRWWEEPASPSETRPAVGFDLAPDPTPAPAHVSPASTPAPVQGSGSAILDVWPLNPSHTTRRFVPPGDCGVPADGEARGMIEAWPTFDHCSNRRWAVASTGDRLVGVLYLWAAGENRALRFGVPAAGGEVLGHDLRDQFLNEFLRGLLGTLPERVGSMDAAPDEVRVVFEWEAVNA